MYRICAALVFIAAGLLAGCVSPAGGNVGVEPPGVPVTYRPGDNIVINFADNPGLPPVWQQVVREDGTITLPLDQKLVAVGKSKGELEEAIQNVYVPRLLTRLTVNVRAEERTYFVRGEVKSPGQRTHTGNLTVMQAIAASGDFTDYADKGDIEVIRANGEKFHLNAKEAQRDSSKDRPIYPGDAIYVNRRFF